MKRWKQALALTLLPLLLLGGCADSEQEATTEFFAMDTVVTARLPDTSDQVPLQQMQARIEELERTLSKTMEDSDVARLNRKRSLPLSELSAETQSLLKTARQISAETDGCLDVTLGALSNLWGFGSDNQQVPSSEELEDALSHSGQANLLLTADTVSLQNGVLLDLGAIAKGYATDEAISLLRERGVQNAMLSLGGNVYVLGQIDGRDWKVGIADPAHPNQLAGTLTLSNKAVVTSGDYQRCFEQDGVRYHHIFDPFTGYPADNELASVTVIHDSATLADGYSTALFVMGLDRAMQFVRAQDGMEAVFITHNGEIFYTDGLQEVFSPAD